jgi:hypothetical protein
MRQEAEAYGTAKRPDLRNMLDTYFVELRTGEVHEGVKGRLAPSRQARGAGEAEEGTRRPWWQRVFGRP